MKNIDTCPQRRFDRGTFCNEVRRADLCKCKGGGKVRSTRWTISDDDNAPAMSLEQGLTGPPGCGPVGPPAKWAATSNVEVGQTTYPVNMGRAGSEKSGGSEGKNHRGGVGRVEWNGEGILS